MANLKEIRTRITSVSSTKQITSAMKMVSAAKLRKAQDAVTKMRPYAEKLQEILVNISQNADTSDNVYAKQKDVSNVLIIAIASNRGLCGAFNSNVVKACIALKETTYKNQKVDIITLGKRPGEVLIAKGTDVLNINTDIYDDLSFANVAAVAEKAMKEFVEGKYDEIKVIYNKFINAASQELITEQFLPISIPEDKSSFSQDYIYEPDKDTIVFELIPKSLKTQLFKAILDSHASEHGARMTAMHKATDNATDLIKELNLEYNKARQTNITNEILEIVGGAEALKS